MQNNLDYLTFILLSPNKYSITVTNLKNEIIFEKALKDIHMDGTKEINLYILENFLKKNIF